MDIIGFVTTHFWNIILFALAITSFLLMPYLEKTIEEGFNIGDYSPALNKDLMCHMLNINIKNHTSLIKEYKERDAVTSLQYATELFEGFSSKFEELDCATHLLTMPPPKTKDNIEIPDSIKQMAKNFGLKLNAPETE
jgi:hypothetical protein